MNHFTTEQIVDTTLKAKELLERAFKVVFGEELEFTIEDVDGHGDCYDLTTDKEDVMLTIEFTGDKPDYYPQGIRHYPGVRYYKDGSGEPPSDEPFDLKVEGTTSVREAIEILLNHVHDYQWQGALEAFQEMMDFPIEHDDDIPSILDED